jgi:hypothetical protein
VEESQVVYWVITKLTAAPRPAAGQGDAPTVERLGPFESRALAAKAREAVATRYRGRPGAKVEIVCDFA